MAEYIRKTREERYKEIRAAALGVFLEKGYRNTTMEDIINATSLSKGGFYHYYKKPKEILFDIMKYGNYRFLEENIRLKEDCSLEEICNSLTNSILNKIFKESPEKKLYLMFAYEIIYDKDFEKVYLELENEAFELIDHKIRNALPEYIGDRSQDKKMFISRLMNAILFAHCLFSNKEIFKNKKEKLYEIFYDIYYGLLKEECKL